MQRHSYTQAAPERTLRFPQDHGPHRDSAIEWWYFTGNLQTEVSERLGFEYVIFRARPGDLAGDNIVVLAYDKNAGLR